MNEPLSSVFYNTDGLLNNFKVVGAFKVKLALESLKKLPEPKKFRLRTPLQQFHPNTRFVVLMSLNSFVLQCLSFF